jgi:acetyltransferase-like isoleucine patch superfamily enzyme
VTVRIHPTAIVEDGVEVGDGTSIWDNVHIRGPSRIGRSCIIGGKSYIAYGVEIGDLVKINSFVYIPTGVVIGTGSMISAGTIFTNDRNPRAADPDLTMLLDSGPQETTERTFVGKGATIGAGCLIGPGLRIGDFAMLGMGAVATRDVLPNHLAVGVPARTIGVVCRCGEVVLRGDLAGRHDAECPACRRAYHVEDGAVQEIDKVVR